MVQIGLRDARSGAWKWQGGRSVGIRRRAAARRSMRDADSALAPSTANRRTRTASGSSEPVALRTRSSASTSFAPAVMAIRACLLGISPEKFGCGQGSAGATNRDHYARLLKDLENAIIPSHPVVAKMRPGWFALSSSGLVRGSATRARNAGDLPCVGQAGYSGADIAEPSRTRRGGRGAQVVGANQPVFRL